MRSVSVGTASFWDSTTDFNGFHLVGDGQLREIRDVPGPLHRAEEQTGGQLTDIVDAHRIVGPALLVVLVSESTAGVRLGSQQLGDELRHWLAAAASSVVVAIVELSACQAAGATYGCDGGAETRLGWDATALNCCKLGWGTERG